MTDKKAPEVLAGIQDHLNYCAATEKTRGRHGQVEVGDGCQDRWHRLRFGKHAGKTLPQILWSDPAYFFWSSKHGVFDGWLAQEAEFLYPRARSIKIPHNPNGRLLAQYIFSRDGTFYDLRLSQRVSGESGHYSKFIDLGVASAFQRQDRGATRRFLSRIKFHLFGNAKRRMSAERCARFFEDDGNFAHLE